MFSPSAKVRAKKSNSRILTKPYHFTNRTHLKTQPFLKRSSALFAWRSFQAGLSAISKGRLIAGILMPDHYHFVILTHRPSEVRKELGAIQSGLARSDVFGSAPLWRRPPRESDLIHDSQKLANVIRYIHLNPCRKTLIDDPWKWEFSTIHEFTSIHRRAAIPTPSRWVPDLEWFNTYFLGPFSPSWNEWCEKMIGWTCNDVTVRPHLIEDRDYQRPRFAGLTQQQIQESIIRIFGLQSAHDLQIRGKAKDLLARAYLHRVTDPSDPSQQPTRIDFHQLAAELEIQPQRLRAFRSDQPLTSEECRWIEHFAGPFFHR